MKKSNSGNKYQMTEPQGVIGEYVLARNECLQVFASFRNEVTFFHQHYRDGDGRTHIIPCKGSVLSTRFIWPVGQARNSNRAKRGESLRSFHPAHSDAEIKLLRVLNAMPVHWKLMQLTAAGSLLMVVHSMMAV